MIYLSQPIAGLLTKNSQLFSGRVSKNQTSVQAGQTTFNFSF